MQKINITETLFGNIYPYIKDDNVTDIKWNGETLWINDLNKGRYIAKDEDGKDLVLDDGWINIFTTKIANSMNVNFNMSSPSMQAETDELRIHAVHKFVAGEEKYALAIRKTPSISRLAKKDLIGEGYVDEVTNAVMPALIRARLSGCVIGDVGSGKTELEKYLCSFIPDVDGIITVEDTLEMKLSKLYPRKDIYSLKITDSYSSIDAIRDALRLLTKWLILSEARGREIVQVMEAASTGCCAMCSIHAENTWEIPERMLNMAGDNARAGFENDIYTFFSYAIKVKADVTNHGIFRKVDQLTFFYRDGQENKICVFYKDGKLTGEEIPEVILNKLLVDKNFVEVYNKCFNKNLVPVEATWSINPDNYSSVSDVLNEDDFSLDEPSEEFKEDLKKLSEELNEASTKTDDDTPTEEEFTEATSVDDNGVLETNSDEPEEKVYSYEETFETDEKNNEEPEILFTDTEEEKQEVKSETEQEQPKTYIEDIQDDVVDTTPDVLVSGDKVYTKEDFSLDVEDKPAEIIEDTNDNDSLFENSSLENIEDKNAEYNNSEEIKPQIEQESKQNEDLDSEEDEHELSADDLFEL